METKKKNRSKAVEIPMVLGYALKKESAVNICSAGAVNPEDPAHSSRLQEDGERLY